MRILLATFISALLFATSQYADARDIKKVEPLLETDRTILGQPFQYPANADPNVTAVIVSLLPGEETGWHSHDVPLFGYMLEGELTVDYGDGVKKIYRKNDALLEAINRAHNGKNTGKSIMRILAVFVADQKSLKSKKEPASDQ